MTTTTTPNPPQWLYVTPELASEWLAFNTHNRNIRWSFVDQLVDEFLDYHPQSISRNCDGTLIDGQHRLLAIVKRGVGAWMLFVDGVDSAMQDHVDIGIGRKPSDVLRLHGYSNTNALSAAARLSIIWKRDPLLTKESGKVSAPRILQYVQGHPDVPHHVNEAVKLSSRSAGIKQPTASRLAVCRMAITSAYGESFADSFLRMLVLGVDISEDSVIFRTRSRLASISTGKDHAIGLSPQKNARMAMWMVLRCAVAHRNGESIKKILYRSDQTPMPIFLNGTINKETNS